MSNVHPINGGTTEAAERELRAAATQERLPILGTLERVDHGIALTDEGGMVRWCNPVLAECYLPGQSPDAWRGRHYTEVFRPLFYEERSWAKTEAALQRLGRTPKGRVEIENVPVNWGGAALRRIDLVLCDLGTADPAPMPGWVGWYFYDLTAFRKTEENLQALLKHSSDGIFMIDADCRLRVFNEACERITGYRAEEVLHREITCNSIFACAHVACTRVDRGEGQPHFCLKKIETDQPREVNIQTKTGQSVWIEVSYAPVAGNDGQVAYVLGILRDVTQRHQLEEQLRLAQKLATLGELSSAMAHEIKNPLGIIMSAAEIIMNPSRPEEQRRQAAEFIRDETRRLDERMRAFLNFSKPRPPEFRLQDINRVLTQTILVYQTLTREGLRFDTRFTPDLPPARIDADQMQQVFLNLLVNADQAMPNGGQVAITTRLSGGGQIEIEVADEGTGLPEGNESRIFEPFFSTKPQGTGLGLSIVMHILAAHRGSIRASNRTPEPGALFVITLPLNENESPEEKGSDEAGSSLPRQ